MTKGMPVPVFLAVLVCSVALTGCEGRGNNSDLEAANGEVLSSVTSGLAKVKRNLADLNDELHATRGIQEELVKQMEALITEREETEVTSKATEQRVEELTAAVNEQKEICNQLENEINALNTVIENQQATINELQTSVAELASMIDQQAVIEQQESIEP
jgi:chromosome segregation ATPase